MIGIKDLHLSYGDAVALSGVSLHVNTGELVAIIGANGAGKTSLIRTIMGIHHAKRGNIVFKGHDITQQECHEICQLGLGHVPEGRQVFAAMTVQENLEVGGLLPRSRKRLRTNLQAVYDLFPRLRERQNQKAGTLSGGEQQMLAIGRCLMAEPELILLDEPSLGLSPVMVQEMFRIIQHLHQQGMTIVLVEQNVAVSLKLADRAYVLENGSIVLEGAGLDLLTHDGVRQAYLGT